MFHLPPLPRTSRHLKSKNTIHAHIPPYTTIDVSIHFCIYPYISEVRATSWNETGIAASILNNRSRQRNPGTETSIGVGIETRVLVTNLIRAARPVSEQGFKQGFG